MEERLRLKLSSVRFVFCEISHFTTFLESWFLVLRRGLSNFAVALISRSIIAMSKLHRKLAVGILHGIIIISKFVRGTTARAIIRKFII